MVIVQSSWMDGLGCWNMSAESARVARLPLLLAALSPSRDPQYSYSKISNHSTISQFPQVLV